MAISIINKEPPYKALATFGTYNVVGTEIPLNESIRNFKAILFRCSSDTDQAAGGGVQYGYIPTAAINNNVQFGCLYQLNGEMSHITIQFTNDTTCKIIASYNVSRGTSPTTQSGLRQIYGIN